MRRLTQRIFHVVMLLCLGCSTAWAEQNVIQAENAKPGTAAWQLTSPSANPTVEGYASHTSVNRGETIRFFVNSAAPMYTLAIYRMGWYGGTGGRLMHSADLQGVQQVIPQPDSVTGLIECNWTESYRFTIPQTNDTTEWASGIYLAKLTPSAGTESYIVFVVRDDNSSSTYAYQSTATTSQAYNNWGGKSLYGFNSDDSAPARKVSFNRPYANSGFWGGAGNFLDFEIYFVHFLEREGYDVTYFSNLDLHTNGGQLLKHKAFLVAGHDEYWSYEMKRAALVAQAQGVHFGFFAANEAYWQVRFEPSAMGEANRTMVAYKEAAQSMDPLALDADSSNDKYITTRFRDLQPIFGVNDTVAQPENALVGLMYHGDPFNGDIVVSDWTSWIYNDSGVGNGTVLQGLLGYETDAVSDNGYSPPQLRVVANSPDPWGGSQMATYTATSGSTVFATGSMQWNWGLDNFSYRNLESDAAKQITRNVLARFAVPPLAAPTAVQATATEQAVNLRWLAPEGASSFNIYRSQETSAEGFTPYRTGLSSTSFSDTGLAGGTYFYTVAAANPATESAQSAEVAVAVGGEATQAQAAGAPRGVVAARGSVADRKQSTVPLPLAAVPTPEAQQWKPYPLRSTSKPYVASPEAWHAVPNAKGVQLVNVVCGSGVFDPREIVVQANLPVELIVRTVEKGRVFVSGFGPVKTIERTGSVHRFTPTVSGRFPLSCEKQGAANIKDRGILAVVPNAKLKPR